MGFKIVFLPSGYVVKDISDDNIDIKVVLTNNKAFSGILFTLNNIQSLLNKDDSTLFWADDVNRKRFKQANNSLRY